MQRKYKLEKLPDGKAKMSITTNESFEITDERHAWSILQHLDQEIMARERHIEKVTEEINAIKSEKEEILRFYPGIDKKTHADFD